LFPLSDEKFISGMHHRWFYHYTNSSSFISSMLAANQKDSKSVDQLFIYTRTHASGSLSWRTVLYVAEDPISSQGFGPRQLRVSFPMNTRVLRPSREIWQNAYSEMSQKYPGLEHACPFLSYGMADGFDGYGDPIAIYSGVFLPMAEDSGADIISYGAGSGKANQMLCKNASQNEVCGRWYQILNPTAIDAVSSP
ncbi:MAG TPA: hypothetical protein VN132_15060, partial [Bdellovibrio sp.]|nr:hypothetical protein [Bdellovibrio sp.]